MLEPLANTVPFYIPQGTIQLEDIYEVSERDFWRKPRTVAVNDLDQLLNEDKPASDRSGLQRDLQLGANYWKLVPPQTAEITD